MKSLFLYAGGGGIGGIIEARHGCGFQGLLKRYFGE
jgi:hypothetical protein